MKHVIYPEATVSITTTSADASYPITNLSDDYRTLPWKAASAVQAATIRCSISANASVLTLHGTNAETAICTITLDSAEKALTDGVPVTDLGGGLVGIPCAAHGFSAGNVVLINGTTYYDGVHTLPSQAAGSGTVFVITDTYNAENVSNTDTACIVVQTNTHTLEAATQTYDRFWQEYTTQAAAHKATITLTAATGETVEAGVFRAGGLIALVGPQGNVSQAPVNYHIEKELQSGATYTKARTVVRSFTYSMLTTRAQTQDILDLYTHYSPGPFAMLITDQESDDNLWCLFGSFQGTPRVNHLRINYDQVSVSFLESL